MREEINFMLALRLSHGEETSPGDGKLGNLITFDVPCKSLTLYKIP